MRVAIVGSGCSGLGAAWVLNRSTHHDVHIFEANDRLGGHTNTLNFKKNGKTTAVDTGFFVFNQATYPNFIHFLEELGIEYVPTEMTFGVSRDKGAFEWAGSTISGIFAQKSNLFSLRFWRMIFDIVRFNHFATDLLVEENEGDIDPGQERNFNRSNRVPRDYESIGAYLDREGYSDAFRNDYLIPMTACVWSTSTDKCDLQFPAITLIRFLWNHHLLSTISARLEWLTIPGGSARYIRAIMEKFPKENVHLSSKVSSVEDINEKIILQFEDGSEELFDHVILACHGDQALELIRDSATQEELDILGGFQTTANVAYLHSDESLMPHRHAAWTAWNYLTSTTSSTKTYSSSNPDLGKVPDSVCLTYNMNILQHIPIATFGHVLVTMNPLWLPVTSSIQAIVPYHHPLYDSGAVRSQKLLPRIQNTRRISYAGAWTKYGFHEDGFSSGVRIAMEHLDAQLPWEFVDSTYSRGKRRIITWKDWIVRTIVSLIQLWIIFLEMIATLGLRMMDSLPGLSKAQNEASNKAKKYD